MAKKNITYRPPTKHQGGLDSDTRAFLSQSTSLARRINPPAPHQVQLSLEQMRGYVPLGYPRISLTSAGRYANELVKKGYLTSVGDNGSTIYLIDTKAFEEMAPSEKTDIPGNNKRTGKGLKERLMAARQQKQ